MIRDLSPIVIDGGPVHAAPRFVCPSLLEPARVQPCYEGMDDMADYAATRGREFLEGMLVVECPEAAR